MEKKLKQSLFAKTSTIVCAIMWIVVCLLNILTNNNTTSVIISGIAAIIWCVVAIIWCFKYASLKKTHKDNKEVS